MVPATLTFSRSLKLSWPLIHPGKKRRRLVLVGGPNEDAEVVNELRRERDEADTETLPSLDEGSVVSGDEETEMPTLELEVHEAVRMATRDAFQSMDVVDLGSEFNRRACVLKTVPVFLKGPFRCASQTALDEICCGIDVSDPIRQTRGWKLLMLLHRLPRGGLISKAKLAAQFEDFSDDIVLRRLPQQCPENAAARISSRTSRRAVRAQSLVQLGELSAGRQALEGADLAPGSIQTRNSPIPSAAHPIQENHCPPIC